MNDGTENTNLDDDYILQKIRLIRNQKVMLDKDLAQLYGVNPRRLREQVKRNIDRFPASFMFQLTENEIDTEVSQIATPLVMPNKGHFGGSLPYAFTEHGVLMLSNVLKSKKAVAVSLRLIEIFVKMRNMLSVHKEMLLKIEQLENKVGSHQEEIQIIFASLRQLLKSEPKKPSRRIGYRRMGEPD